jgi:hypothetical protein
MVIAGGIWRDERRAREKRMDFSSLIDTMNTLLGRYQPRIFNSSWIRTHAPRCYRFIRKNLRGEFGGIDWDRFTYALDRKFQRRWIPARRKKNPVPYKDQFEVDMILKQYRDKLYVFLTSLDKQDRRIRDMIGIKFVRLAQKGNLLARKKLVGLIKYTIDGWIERDYFLSRWRGYEDEIQKHVVACIRRYRYSGSFITYLFRTLQCAARGIRPARFYSLEQPGCEIVMRKKIEWRDGVKLAF